MRCFTVHPVTWRDAEPLLRAVREAVFVCEQQVPLAMEWDGLDEDCRHVLALSATGQPIGCARITPQGQIGRMAVLPAWRLQSVGTAMLEVMLHDARQQRHPVVMLHAQLQAVPFYRRFGFVEYGEEFLDAGIPHIRMKCLVDD